MSASQGLPSPAAAGTPENRSLRMHTYTRLHDGGGEGRPVTLRNPLEAAARRVAEARAQVRGFIMARQYRKALNTSLAALQREMAKEAARRPGVAVALYQGVSLNLLEVAEKLPGFELQPGDPVDGGDFR